jgi:hypothetical protein
MVWLFSLSLTDQCHECRYDNLIKVVDRSYVPSVFCIGITVGNMQQLVQSSIRFSNIVIVVIAGCTESLRLSSIQLDPADRQPFIPVTSCIYGGNLLQFFDLILSRSDCTIDIRLWHRCWFLQLSFQSLQQKCQNNSLALSS